VGERGRLGACDRRPKAASRSHLITPNASRCKNGAGAMRHRGPVLSPMRMPHEGALLRLVTCLTTGAKPICRGTGASRHTLTLVDQLGSLLRAFLCCATERTRSAETALGSARSARGHRNSARATHLHRRGQTTTTSSREGRERRVGERRRHRCQQKPGEQAKGLRGLWCGDPKELRTMTRHESALVALVVRSGEGSG